MSLIVCWIQFGPNLAPSWATLVQELVLDELVQYVSGLDELVMDGLLGLREASRIFIIG